MFRSAPGVQLPLLKKASIAKGHHVGVRDPQPRDHGVNPVIRAFEFSKQADWRLVDHAVAATVSELCTPLFIDEGWFETEHGEDAGDGIPVLNFSLGLDTMLM